MPLLNSRGDVLAGVAGVQGSLNGVPFPFQSFGGGCWLDDDTVLVSLPAPPPFNAILATWRPADGAAPVPLPDNRGANDFAAGGGRFIAWLAGFGVWGSLGELPAAGLPGSGSARAALCVAPDGTIGYIPNRGYGYGLQVVDPNGLVHDVAGIYAGAEQTVRAGVAIWAGGAIGIPVPVPACQDAQNVVVAELPDGELWLVYWSSAVGFIAQRDGDADGYILGTTPTFFNHHARAVQGELLIAWSNTQGEGPGDVHTFPIDRTAARVALVPPAPEPEPPDPEPEPEPPDPEPEPPDPEPEPPDPGPEPEPEPEPTPPPEEDSMLTVDITTPPIKAVTGEKVDAGDGFIAVQFTDPQTKAITYLGVDAGGALHYDATTIGPDEKFKYSGGALVNTNTYDGVKVVILPCVETT